VQMFADAAVTARWRGLVEDWTARQLAR
jgi:hypothetical protein